MSESEIKAAAERWRRFFHGEMTGTERDEYYHDALSVEDRDALCQWASDHLAADRAERRPLPNAVKQTAPTNCFRACVATVLEIPIDDVPTACDGATWDWDEFQRWLAGRGLQAIEIGFANGGTIYPVSAPVPCIITGPSPRGCRTGQHAVVGELIGIDGFRLLHDPHPSDLWIDGEPTHATFFARLSADRAEREGWQPIETAPKDGTAVIVWPPSWPGVTSCARYDDDHCARHPRPYWDRGDAITVVNSRTNPPSHWKPCLTGPSEPKGGAK